MSEFLENSSPFPLDKANEVLNSSPVPMDNFKAEIDRMILEGTSTIETPEGVLNAVESASTPGMINPVEILRSMLEERVAIALDPSRPRSERRRAEREIRGAVQVLSGPGLNPSPSSSKGNRRSRRSARKDSGRE